MTPADRQAIDDNTAALRSHDRALRMLAPIWML
jgi:hypothetical protein